jgi:hypothetical protein
MVLDSKKMMKDFKFAIEGTPSYARSAIIGTHISTNFIYKRPRHRANT